MKGSTRSNLRLEDLEDRCVPSATVTLNNGVLSIVADNKGDNIIVQNTSTSVEVLINSQGGKTYDFTPSSVTSITFQGGNGINGDSFINLTALPSVQTAGANFGVNYLQGGTGTDTLTGDPNPFSESYLTDTAGANNVLNGGAGFTNIFAGNAKGNDTINAGSGYNAVYDILGTDTINGGTGAGYLIVNAQSAVTANANEQVVTFFQNGFNSTTATGTLTTPTLLQQDVNGNGILYLLPQATTGYSYTINQVGKGAKAKVEVNYQDANGPQTATYSLSQVSWIATFGLGNNAVINNTSINDVFYGSVTTGAYHELIGGYGVNVIKGHGGTSLIEGRGYYNDLSAGSNGTDTVIGSTDGLNIFRNRASAIATTDLNYRSGDLIINVPVSVTTTRGVTYSDSQDTGLAATNQDFAYLYSITKNNYGFQDVLNGPYFAYVFGLSNPYYAPMYGYGGY